MKAKRMSCCRWELLTVLVLLGLISCNGVSGWSLDQILPATKGKSKNALPPSKQQGEAFLQSLNLKSPTDPQRFSVRNLQHAIDVAGASIPAIFRLGAGALAEGWTVGIYPRNNETLSTAPFVADKQIEERCWNWGYRRQMPKENIILYDCESNPECKLVREACSILGLKVTMRPCPSKKAVRFVPQLQQQYGGRLPTLPVVEDPNTKVVLTADGGVQKLVEYLFQVYGKKDSSMPWNLKGTEVAAAKLGLQLGFGGGKVARSSDPPPLPLQVWLYESSPFGKLVRESVVELELEHVVTYCPRGSANRQDLYEETGRFQVPYLKDPNTGVCLWESQAICEYLEKVYGATTNVNYL